MLSKKRRKLVLEEQVNKLNENIANPNNVRGY